MKITEQQKKVAQEIYKKLKIIDPYALLADRFPNFHRSTKSDAIQSIVKNSINELLNC